MTCNQRKAIAPTQFNPMSTRGHCIMVLEVEMPGEMEVTKLFHFFQYQCPSYFFVANLIYRGLSSEEDSMCAIWPVLNPQAT
jgi:hypothetical protein